MSSYCTAADYEILPGVFTHNLTKEEVESSPEYGCCQSFVCGLSCPKSFDKSGIALGFGPPIVVFAVILVVLAFCIGMLVVKVNYKTYFVCGRSLPLYIVALSLFNEAFEYNGTAVNISLVYKYAFWDGAVFPISIALALILNGLTLAGPINRMKLLTLPDVFHRQYGVLSEVMVSLMEIAGFICLIASNLVGISTMLQFVFDLPRHIGIIITVIITGSYTVVGGLMTMAFLDVLQAHMNVAGCVMIAVWAVTRETIKADTSLGFAINLGDNVTATTPGYAGPLDCIDPTTGVSTCDNFAYPMGDKVVVTRGMIDADAYAPFPNAILLNWATVVALCLGDICALDFQSRTMAAESPRAAIAGNIIGGCLMAVAALPLSLVGGLARKHYGPDSAYAEFNADSCSAPLGLPSCAEWVPNERYVLFQLLWQHLPRILGGWGVLAIFSGCISTCDGALLAASTVFGHNILRRVKVFRINSKNLLLVVRCAVVFMTAIACSAAILAYDPGYLVFVSFDIIMAGVLAPLLAAVYLPGVTPNAGILSTIAGGLLRVILEVTLPKDGSLVAFGKYALAYGPALPGLPSFLEVFPPEATTTAGLWDPATDTCQQKRLEDWTGLDTLVSPAFAMVVLLSVHYFEKWTGRDILFFVPKSWRTQSPLYQEDADRDDESHHCDEGVVVDALEKLPGDPGLSHASGLTHT